MTSSKKLIRHRSLKKLLRDNPFSTDEQLAKMLDVSVQTIRLDRVALGIPELRARTRTMAEEAQTKLRAIDKKRYRGRAAGSGAEQNRHLNAEDYTGYGA